MTTYGLCLLLAAAGLLVAAFDAVLLWLTPRLLGRIGRLGPEHRPAAILLARFAPIGLAFAVVASILVPAWVRHEPANSGAAASGPLVALALLTLLPAARGLARTADVLRRTRARLRSWRAQGRSTSRLPTPYDVMEVSSSDLSLCVGGYLKPTIYASTRVMAVL